MHWSRDADARCKPLQSPVIEACRTVDALGIPQWLDQLDTWAAATKSELDKFERWRARPNPMPGTLLLWWSDLRQSIANAKSALPRIRYGKSDPLGYIDRVWATTSLVCALATQMDAIETLIQQRHKAAGLS